MTIVLEEEGLTSESAELEIENRSMRYLDAENLNLHHEKIQRMHASIEHVGLNKAEITHN